jgi:F-type H+-transporting ATPase subunit delta
VPSATARRYARALFELATEERQLDAWEQRLEQVRRILSVPELRAVIENPAVAPAQRLALIDSLPLDDIGEEGRNLAKLLIESAHSDAIADIEEEFSRLADEERGRVQVTVTTAVELQPEGRERLARQLGEQLGRDVRLEYRTDPAILGGLVAQIGDRLVDASLRSRLQQLRRQLAGV